MVLTTIGFVLLCITTMACLQVEKPLYLAIHNLSEETMSYLGWVLVPIIFMVIRSTLKNLYKVTKHLNKQIKTTLEQVDKEGS